MVMTSNVGARWRLGAAALVGTLLLAACGGGTVQSTGPSTPAGSQGSGEVVEIEWYVGLGTGTNPEQIPVQEEQVALFNEQHPNIRLTLTVVDSEVAEQDLATRLPTNPPDIIGPIGIRGLQGYGDSLLDLTESIESAGVDRASIDEALWDV